MQMLLLSDQDSVKNTLQSECCEGHVLHGNLTCDCSWHSCLQSLLLLTCQLSHHSHSSKPAVVVVELHILAHPKVQVG
jgi:hypothetical protein